MGRLSFAVESAAARICREGGARVAITAATDLAAPNPGDAQRLEIVADGLPLFGSAQLAIDTTLISTLHCEGSARPGTADTDSAALAAAKRRRAHISGAGRPRGKARLVGMLASEVGGRWSPVVTRDDVPKSRHEPGILRQRVQQAWTGKRSCHAQPPKRSQGRCWSFGVLRDFQGLLGWAEQRGACVFGVL